MDYEFLNNFARKFNETVNSGVFSIDFFDYRENWDKVLPIIDTPKMRSILDECVREYISYRDVGPGLLRKWQNSEAPYEIGSSYSMMDLFNKVNTSPEWNAYLDAHEDEPPNDESSEYFSNLVEEMMPKPHDLEFYQMQGGGKFLAKWQKAIAESFYDPKDVYEYHGIVYVLGRDNNTIIFDIVEFESVEWPHWNEFDDLMDSHNAKQNA
jgi:hypothetical protein